MCEITQVYKPHIDKYMVTKQKVINCMTLSK